MSENALPGVGDGDARALKTGSRAAERPLRIALLGYRSNPYSGGQGVYLKFLSRALVAAGHQVDVISGEPYPELDDDVRLIKLPGLNLFAQANHVTALRPRHLLSATDSFEWFSMLTGGFPEPYTFGRRLQGYFAANDLGSEQGYDVIHDNQSLSYGLLSLDRGDTPVFCTIHHPITWDRDIALAHGRSWRERLLIKRWHSFLTMQTRVARKLEHIVTVSESSKRDICSAFDIEPERVTVVYNGIDTDTFCPEPSIARNRWQLITTASADQPLKGTQHLIPAFAELCQEFPKLRLVFIGKPKPGGHTERLIEALGVKDRIRFVHGISTNEIRYLYAGSAIAVVPSEYEGFGLPAGEAMACGTPVVSTDGGALPEVVGDAGRIVPARDSTALAQAIAELLEDDQQREALGSAGRERILARFSWQRAAQQLTALYSRELTDQ
ncbi:MAG: glycosyltransferase family 4 protein [Gammaproteobacteria bacterium]|nr:glycosyltransferase family 4 protein [Gammaproteobacteria bacterium]